MKNSPKQLLLEALSLRLKYSTDDFEQVISTLKNKNNDPYLLEILELCQQIDNLSRQESKSRNIEHKKPSLINEKMQALKVADPERYTLLSEIAERLNSNLFPAIRDLQQHVSKQISIPVNKRSRSEIISVYLLHFLDASVDAIKKEAMMLSERKPGMSEEVNAFVRMANKISETKK